MKYRALSIVAFCFTVCSQAAPLELKKGDHICIIGNTLADRMQHDGWLETLIHARFPSHELTFRDLGFSGDEITTRIRSQWFGSPDEWLAGVGPCPNPKGLVTRIGVRENRFETTNTRADVVFAFFGYNESWAGAAGLDKFKSDLNAFIKHTLSQKYNGKTAPRLVLFSPTAFENHQSPNLPDGRDINERLAMYSKAMAEAAKANDVEFVDLFGETSGLFARSKGQYTINGVHLNEAGNHHVAQVAVQSLFGAPKAALTQKQLADLRNAVLEKNFYWFNRYRVMDGFNVYGGRAFEKYADSQSNYEDQQRELEIFDVKTANRDRRIWAVAQGRDLTVDDSNCPPLIPVKTNRPQYLPQNGHVFLDGDEAIRKMTVAKGMKVSLFASEKDFPGLLEKPVQMQFDAKGRLWVAVWPSYPRWKPTEVRNDKILIFEDTNGDGRADKCIVYADGLNCPTGFDFWNGGVLVAQAPDLLFLKDSKGGDKADTRVRVLHGLDSADSHHTANSFVMEPGGGLYFQEGTFHHTQVEDPYGPSKRCANGGVFRYEPRTQRFDVYVSTGFANPHGHVFDRWGQDIVVDGTGANPYHAALFSGHLNFPDKHPKPPQVYQQRTRPCPGMEYLSSKHFPDEFQDNLLVANVISVHGILRYKISDKGSSFAGTELEPIVTSSDYNFRPTDLKVGPDGAIWFVDWQNPIIGHLQHAIRDPARDRTHGRIYRITYEGRELAKSPKIDGEPISRLLDLLKEQEERVRYRVRSELTGRNSDEVAAAAKTWIAGLDPKDPNYEHHMLEALWLHQSHNMVNIELLKRMLTSPDFRARAAATRVACQWRDRVPGILDILKSQAADGHARVRLEAVRAASFFTVPEAAEIPLIASEQPVDEYIAFTRTETMRVLDPMLKSALAAGKEVNFTTMAGRRYLLRTYSVDQLTKMERTRAVNLELLYRTGVRDDIRKDALRRLAHSENKPELKVLIDTISGVIDSGRDEAVLFELIRLMSGRPAAELAAVRPDLERLATTAPQPIIREVGFVAMINVDGSPDKAWELATRSVQSLRDLLAAMPLMADAGLRGDLYPKVVPLLQGLPANLAAKVGNAKGVAGRYVRIDLKGRKTLSLAEVQVLSNGKNVALKKKASQINTSHGGSADKAVDGTTAGIYGMGSMTHTQENAQNPWWEVDLGEELPIDTIIVWNRTEGDLGNRLNNFNIRVLDRQRNEVFKRENNSAPARKAEFELGGAGPVVIIRRAAMEAMTSVRGQELATFNHLAKFVRDDSSRADAIHALQRVPRSYWPAAEAEPLLGVVLAHIRKIPTGERTSPSALDALEFADGLASLLAPEKAKVVRAELGELGVRVVRLYSLPERMAFDKELIVVKAGKPVEFIFENTDLMPHNFVIIKPGSLEEIGKLAEATAQSPDAQARHFVPRSHQVLIASDLLQTRAAQKLSWVAPKEPGVYPFVCTYPGHWMRMHGALYVVADLDEYQANPDAYLAKHPLEVKDTLLKNRRPRTEWTLADLSPMVLEMKGGRSYGSGRQMFQTASCVSCHKLEGQGNEFGADLTKLDPKLTINDILKDIVEPSSKINEKYQPWKIEMKSGKTYTGIILAQANGKIQLIENPLASPKPIEINEKDIDIKEKSNVSIMPKGLLDKLTRDEILDLLAYIYSRGNKDHKLFQGEKDH